MPTSPYDDTVEVLDFLGRLILNRRASILDVGAGFGRWGFLVRCHFGYGSSLTVNPDQPLRIDAIEGFATNITPLYSCVYNHTYVGDAAELLPQADRYNIIIMSHVLEHFEKPMGKELLAIALAKATDAVIVNIPLGVWDQGEEYGNPLEVHKSSWYREDFKGAPLVSRVYGVAPRQYAVFILAISPEARWHVKMMRSRVRRGLFHSLLVVRRIKQRITPGLMLSCT